jgi:hypothetical protein
VEERPSDGQKRPHFCKPDAILSTEDVLDNFTKTKIHCRRERIHQSKAI